MKAYRQNQSKNQRRELRDGHKLRQECFAIARKCAADGIGPLRIDAAGKLSAVGHITTDDDTITLPEGSETTIEHTSIDCGSYAVDDWTPLRNERDT